MLVLSIPAVQTRLGKYVTNRVNSDYKTNINIGKIGLQFNGDVELKEILIRDYKQDTLISAVELNTSILNFKNLYNSKLAFGDIDLEGLIFNIKTYKDATETNLDVFVARFDEDTPTNEKSDFLLSSSDVTITDGTFRLIDENKETPEILEFNAIDINATTFIINGSDVSMRVNNLAFLDSRGLEMKNLVTDFSYTPEHIFLEDLNIETKSSALEGEVKFLFKREDLKEFTDKVNVDATFTKADIALNELNTFYNEFGVNQRATFSTKVSGTLNNMKLDDLRLNTSSRSKVYGDITFKNLFNTQEENFHMNGYFSNLSSNYRDLKALLPNVLGETIPSSFEHLGNFTIVGQSQVSPKTIKADIEIDTDLGFINSNLVMNAIDDIDNASYVGNIILTDFDIGQFLEDPTVKLVSLNLDVDGKGFTKENVNTKLLGDIFSLNYNNYTYQNIEVSGTLKDKVYNGKLISNDKNLKLKFNGLADISKETNVFDFVAEVDYANLKALNFVKNDSLSVFKGDVEMNMEGTSFNDAEGSIQFTNTLYENEHDIYEFNDFAITSSFKNKVRYIDVNSPDIIEGQLSGEFLFEDIAKLFENAIGSMYANYRPHEVAQDQYVNFNFNIYNKIVEVFVPDIKLGANTFIKGHVESDEKAFKLNFRSPKIELYDYFAQAIDLQVDNKNPVFNAYVEIDSLNTNYYNASKFNLINITLNDTMYVRSEFNGGKHNRDKFNLSFYHTIDADNKSVIGFKKSDVTFKENTWIINENSNRNNKIVFDKKFTSIKIDSFMMNHNREQIKLSGIIRDSTYKDIKLHFKDVELAHITPDIDSLKLKGNINGKLDILQENGNYLPNSTVTIDAFEVNDLLLGSFDAHIKGNETLTNYQIDAKIKNDIEDSFNAIGNIYTSGKTSTIDVDLNFKNFNLQPLNPFLAEVLSNIRGLVTGQARVEGDLGNPSINGDLLLNKAGLTVPFLNVDYDFAEASSVTLDKQSFVFNNIGITDTKYNTKGKVDGSINHVNFSNWSLDLEVTATNTLVLDTEEDEDLPYYGTAFIDGFATLIGPTEQLVIDVVAQTKPNTVFKIPLSDTESFGDNSFIHFLTPEEKLAKQKGEDIRIKDVSGLEMDFDLDITKDAEIEIVIDKSSGSTIKGRGIGGILLDINTNGKFKIYGDFSVVEGVYNFLYGGLVQKEFTVEPGGSIAWNGDPLKANIDLKAIYKTNANPSPLLDNPINRSIPVYLETSLTGQLEKPDINFDFEFPNLSSTVKSELEYRLESKEDRDNQALYLLATGSFSDRLNVNFTGTITERLNGIVNGIFSDSNNKVKVGLNYEAGANTPDYQTDDRLGVTLQTNITDRVMINGKVGVPVGGVSETVIAGDVQIDFLLNTEGTLTAKVFNRENSIRNFGEEIGYTQGLGISYNVDFDTFKELLQIIFKGKSEAEEEKEEEEEETDEALPSYIGFKKEKND